ncbi:MAG: hypothetical protein EXR91_11330 [Gemmatimonadetes bacterium]|nr:hypothetical protein [Gemmatimonadota bacterium]
MTVVVTPINDAPPDVTSHWMLTPLRGSPVSDAWATTRRGLGSSLPTTPNWPSPLPMSRSSCGSAIVDCVVLHAAAATRNRVASGRADRPPPLT